MSHRDDLRKLIAIHTRRLQKRKEQQALYGASVDPSVLIEIEDIETEIEVLQAELEQLEQDTPQAVESEQALAAELSQPIDSSTPVQIFVSYSRQDLEFTRRLADDLEQAGFSTWWDVSELRGGDTWVETIQAALEVSKYCLVLLSPNSVSSEWVRREYVFAMNLGLRIIPLFYRDCNIPLALIDKQYVDFRGNNYQQGLSNLLMTLTSEDVPPPQPDQAGINRMAKKATDSFNVILNYAGWQGIAGILAVIGLLWAFYSYFWPNPVSLEQAATATVTTIAAAPTATQIQILVSTPPPTGSPRLSPTSIPFSEPVDTPTSMPGTELLTSLPPTSTATPAPTVLRYPPPSPAPDVPPGPLQSELPAETSPVCDAAEYLGVYSGNTSQRIHISEPDDVAAKVVGGTTVYRAWRLRNAGTCVWEPGYELTFYGGRPMGSGGVSFEEPESPTRRNMIVDSDSLIVPQGKPNQVAVLELLLTAPPNPGIYQSYWRMRNSQGDFFGPIIGVTFEVVRECQMGVYGSPVINSFEILGVGSVYQPVDPVNVMVESGDPVTLEWNIINATSFEINAQDQTGNRTAIEADDFSDRASFQPDRLGRYVITLFADNGPCTISAELSAEVVPSAEEVGDTLEIR